MIENFRLIQEPEVTVEVLETEPATLCRQCKSGIMDIVETLLPHGPPHIIFRNEILRWEYAV
jgi:hypothetical protein